MKKQIARTISTLSLIVLLSGGAINVSASGGACSIPSCRPRPEAVPAPAKDVTQVSTQDLRGQETAPTAQPDKSFSFAFLLVRWAMSFPGML